MARFYDFVTRLMVREEEGQGLVEYGLIIALVAVVAVGALQTLGGGVSGVLEDISGSL